jgi:hypothetical protein
MVGDTKMERYARPKHVLGYTKRERERERENEREREIILPKKQQEEVVRRERDTHTPKNYSFT